jgi:hypothetical protein
MREHVLMGATAFTAGDAVRLEGTVFPPDVSLAASPSRLVVGTNGGLWYGVPATGARVAVHSLAALVGAGPQETPTDPNLVYDPLAGRFYLVVIVIDASGSTSRGGVAASRNAAPRAIADWHVWALPQGQSVYDYPRPALTREALVWSTFDFAAGVLTGVRLWRVGRGDLAGTAPLNVGVTDLPPVYGGLVPAQSMTPTSRLYLPVLDGASLRVLAYTTSATGSDTITEAILPLPAEVALPPFAVQRGSGTTLDTGDERVLSAAWRAGKLWLTRATTCLPARDTADRACLAVWEVDTAGMRLVRRLTMGARGRYLYNPAVAIDAAARAHLVYTASGPDLAPSIAATFVNTRVSWASAQALLPGPTTYVSLDPSPARWGDFATAVPVPGSPYDLFVANETTMTTTAPRPNWSTTVWRISALSDKATLRVPPARIRAGSAVALSGTVRRPAGPAVRGALVRLDAWSGSRWVRAGSVRTSSAGTWRLVQRVRRTTTYRATVTSGRYPALGSLSTVHATVRVR